MSNWIFYLVIGKLLIFLWQNFPLPSFLEKIKSIKKLHECGLCCGVWFFSGLAFFMKMDVLSILGFWYMPFISELASGGLSSLLVHLLTLGWKAQFEVVRL